MAADSLWRTNADVKFQPWVWPSLTGIGGETWWPKLTLHQLMVKFKVHASTFLPKSQSIL